MITEQDREAIDEILDCFDFHKVEQVVKHLEWKWHSCGGVPERWDLRRSARNSLEMVVTVLNTSTTEYETGTGGFIAEGRLYPGDTKKYLKLSFVVADWDNYD